MFERKMVLASLALCLVFSACSRSEKTIRIGVAQSLSGELSSWGLSQYRAAELQSEQVNLAGGIDGKKIILVKEDDRSFSLYAEKAAGRLLKEKVIAVFGHTGSAASEAALPTYTAAGIVLISASATKDNISDIVGNSRFFRTVPPESSQAEAAVTYAAEKLGAKRFAIFHDKADYGRTFAQKARQSAEEKGLEVPVFEGLTTSSLDFSQAIAKIIKEKADCVIWGGLPRDLSKLLAQVRERGQTIPFISDDAVKSDTFLKTAGNYAEGVYATAHTQVSDSGQAIKALSDYKKRYGEEAGPFFLTAYTAFEALLNAIDKADKLDSEAVAKALRSETVDTPLGTIGFDGKGEITGFGFTVYEVEEGAWVGVSAQ